MPNPQKKKKNSEEILEVWTELKAKIKSFKTQVLTQEYHNQPSHLRLMEHQRTLQEWLDFQYPDANIRKYVTHISSYKINATRRSYNINWNLAGGPLDLTQYPNLETVYFEYHEMSSPLTELNLTGCQKIRRIHIKNPYPFKKEPIEIIKTHLTPNQLKTILDETDKDIAKRTMDIDD